MPVTAQCSQQTFFPCTSRGECSSRAVPSTWETTEGRDSLCSINSKTGLKDQGPEDTRQSRDAKTSLARCVKRGAC